MDAYISEAQLMSCDVVETLHIDILHKDFIQPGHKTICCAKINLERKGHSPRIIKGKLDSCGSVSIAHKNLLSKIKSARQYGLSPIRLRGIGGKPNLLNKVGILRIR
jgi:hypothetical protein